MSAPLTREQATEHCKDCCCARSWEALGVITFTGLSIPEHIAALRQHAQDDRDTIQGLEQDVTLLSEQLATAEERTEMALTQLAERDSELAKWKRIRTPTHGNCCTCQACGLAHEYCRCDIDEICDDLTQLKQQLEQVRQERELAKQHRLTDDEFKRKYHEAMDILSEWQNIDSAVIAANNVALKQQLEQRTQERDAAEMRSVAHLKMYVEASQQLAEAQAKIARREEGKESEQ